MNTYTNPIKKHGDFADPFVIRYNGTYYLYGTNPDIRCWSSVNLVDWKEEGATISSEEFPGLVPFAPEVVYYNGSFYMYTSPSGLGHFVLKSDSPTGPFKKLTGNVGHNIDGSVFIDDDGSWYFYWAHDEGIMGCRMDAPDKFGQAVNTGAFLHGWTEGPQVIKEDGLYYMTYTGNHYLSAGYRINAAVSEHPLGPYKDSENNPVLVHTTGRNIGLGHNSLIIGPDLATRYIVYHNMNPDLTRDLNIDVIQLKDGRVQVAGPSRLCQPLPEMALCRICADDNDFQEHWYVEDAIWNNKGGFFVSDGSSFKCRSKQRLLSQGIVEYNLFSDAKEYGVLLGENQFRFNKEDNSVSFVNHEGRTVSTRILVEHYNHGVIHCMTVHYEKECMKTYLDGLPLFEGKVLVSEESRAGYFAEGGAIGIGTTVISGAVKNKSAACYPIPCSIYSQNRFRVNVPESGEYEIYVLADKINNKACSLTVFIDGIRTAADMMAYNNDSVSYKMELDEGQHEIDLSFGSEIFEPRKIYIFKNTYIKEDIYKELHIAEPDGKAVINMPQVSDLKATLSFKTCSADKDSEAGMIFRATELARGGEGDDELLGINFFIGYSISVRKNRLVLSKHKYNKEDLADAPIEANENENYRISVKACLNDIEVFVNGEEVPSIRFHDREPILWGVVGARATGCCLEKIYINVLE